MARGSLDTKLKRPSAASQGCTSYLKPGLPWSTPSGPVSERRAAPRAFGVARRPCPRPEAPVWYVLARDVDKGEARMFRMDRIARPRLLPEVVFRPDVAGIEAQFPDLERWRPLTGRWTT
jgi:hypothetical protein